MATQTQFHVDADRKTVLSREESETVVAFRACASARIDEYISVDRRVPLDSLPELERIAHRVSNCRSRACSDPKPVFDDERARAGFELDGFGNLAQVYERDGSVVFVFFSPTLSPDMLGGTLSPDGVGGWTVHITYENGPDPAMQGSCRSVQMPSRSTSSGR